MPRLLVVLACCLIALPGCFYSAGYYYHDYDYSVAVVAVADPETTFSGVPVDLTSVYAIDNATVYISEQDWTVIEAPFDATFALDDDGRDATLLAATPGDYKVLYRTWYYTNYDYDYCYCTTSTGYRESFVIVTVLPAPPG